jgi:predicted HD superfamily hydrolase involved in NAD metabolism
MGYTVNNIEKEALEMRIAPMVNEKRLAHIKGVVWTCTSLARRYGEDEDKAILAAFIHDALRGQSDAELLGMARQNGFEVDDYTAKHPKLLHGPMAAIWAQRELGVHDEAVLAAVRAHTTGDAKMDKLTCILYLADCMEPGRDYEGINLLRVEAERSLYSATLLALEQTEKHLLARGRRPHPVTYVAAKVLKKKIMEEVVH